MSRSRSVLFRADVTRGFGSPTVGTGKRSFPRERRQGGNAVGKVSTVPRTPRARLRRFDTTPRRLHTPPFVQRAVQDASHPSSRNVVSRQSRHHDFRRIRMTYKGGPDAAAVRIPRAPSAFRTDSDRGLARISRGLEFASRRRPRPRSLARSPSPRLLAFPSATPRPCVASSP